MSTVIKGSALSSALENEAAKEPHFLQFVPAKIKSNDEKAKVKPFFNDYISENKDNGQLTTILRGRPFNGKVRDLGSFKAAIMKMPKSANTVEDDEITSHPIGVCDKMTVWNYDLPSDKGTDPLSKALTYAHMASIMNKD